MLVEKRRIVYTELRVEQKLKSIQAWQTCVATMLAALLFFGNGCTAYLWQDSRFERRYHPASQPELHLYYSNLKRDLLVQYSESCDETEDLHVRFYWLEPNAGRIFNKQKPVFVSSNERTGLAPVRVLEAAPVPGNIASNQLYAVTPADDWAFTLYSGVDVLGRYELPVYTSSQHVLQVLLTPFAVAVDAVIVGTIAVIVTAPQILADLATHNRL